MILLKYLLNNEVFIIFFCFRVIKMFFRIYSMLAQVVITHILESKDGLCERLDNVSCFNYTYFVTYCIIVRALFKLNISPFFLKML